MRTVAGRVLTQHQTTAGTRQRRAFSIVARSVGAGAASERAGVAAGAARSESVATGVVCAGVAPGAVDNGAHGALSDRWH